MAYHIQSSFVISISKIYHIIGVIGFPFICLCICICLCSCLCICIFVRIWIADIISFQKIYGLKNCCGTGRVDWSKAHKESIFVMSKVHAFGILDLLMPQYFTTKTTFCFILSAFIELFLILFVFICSLLLSSLPSSWGFAGEVCYPLTHPFTASHKLSSDLLSTSTASELDKIWGFTIQTPIC